MLLNIDYINLSADKLYDRSKLGKQHKYYSINILYEQKRFYIHKILLLKSAFSIIDQLFQQEVTNAQAMSRYLWSRCCYKKPIPPEESNEFIKYILDPFEGGTIHNWEDKKFIERREDVNHSDKPRHSFMLKSKKNKKLKQNSSNKTCWSC